MGGNKGLSVMSSLDRLEIQIDFSLPGMVGITLQIHLTKNNKPVTLKTFHSLHSHRRKGFFCCYLVGWFVGFGIGVPARTAGCLLRGMQAVLRTHW